MSASFGSTRILLKYIGRGIEAVDPGPRFAAIDRFENAAVFLQTLRTLLILHISQLRAPPDA